VLSLVSVPIGNLKDITLRALEVLQEADTIACEDTRFSLKLLSHYGISKPLLSYHEHNAEQMRPRLLSLLKEGKKIAYITDGGMPLISDPGFKLVVACQEHGFPYTVIPGPSAPLTALCLSGLSPSRFLFGGFLSPKTGARKRALEEVSSEKATLIFFESPKRLVPFLKDAHEVLGDRIATVCREMTKLFEETKKGSFSTLITFYEQTPPRGEIVVVIEGNMALEKKVIDLDYHLNEAFKSHSLKEAVDLVSKAYNLPKREVYQHALKLSSEKTRLSKGTSE
jgi:16S rRNA (cytidine1402-2'-O)-methyltransferase